MIQQGYQHGDISLGNMLMFNEAVKTKVFEIIKPKKMYGEDATVANLTGMLEELKIKPSAT